MKKFALLLFIPLIFAFIGCEDEPAEDILAPTGIVVAAATNGLDIVLNWTTSATAEIDGYRVYRAGSTTPLWEGTATTASLTNPAFGNYEIVAYKGSDESDGADFSLGVYTGTATGVFRRDQSGPSGFGWNLTSGTGSVLSFTTPNAPQIDIYYDNDETITSASFYGGAFTNVTGILLSTTAYNSLNTAPDPATAVYNLGEDIGLNQTYALYIKKTYDYGYFAKVEITAVNTTAHSIDFRWTLQKVAKWRKLG